MDPEAPHTTTNGRATPRRRQAAENWKVVALGHCTAAGREWRRRRTVGEAVGTRRHASVATAEAPGRPARLTDAHQQGLWRKLKRGDLAAGFPSHRWTMGRVRQLIEREFGVRYHVKYINRCFSWARGGPKSA